MPRPTMSPEQRAAADERARSSILRAMGARLSEEGFHGTSVAEVARLARVSNSTVYALFEDKEAIFVALYESLNELLRQLVDAAVQEQRRRGRPWPQQLRAGIAAYLRAMIAGGGLSWCLLVEATSISPRTQAARRDALGLYADMLAEYADRVATDNHLDLRLSPELTLAAIGGMNELLLLEMEQKTNDLDSLVDSATQLFAMLFNVGLSGQQSNPIEDDRVAATSRPNARDVPSQPRRDSSPYR